MVDIAEVARAYDDVKRRVHGSGVGDDAPAACRIGDEQGEGSRRGYAEVLEDQREGGVAVAYGFAVAVAGHGVGVHFGDDIGDAAGLCSPGHDLAAYAEADDDEVVLEQAPVAYDAAFVRLFHVGFIGRGLAAVGAVLGKPPAAEEQLRRRRSRADEQGREHHGENAGSKEDLIGAVVEQAEAKGGLGQHEGEFTHLGKAEGHQQGRTQGIVQGQHGRHGHQYLHRDDGRSDSEDDRDMGHEELHVEQHAHGHEEDAGKHFLEGKHGLQRVQAVFRFRQHEACKERAEGQRKAYHIGDERHGEAEAQRGHQHEFAASGTDHAEHEPGQDELAEEQDAADSGNALAGGKGHGVHIDIEPAAQKREHEHHRDDGKVLKDQHGKAGAALRGVHLRLLLEQTEHDGRGRKRDHTAVHQPEAHAAPPEGEAEHGGHREDDLRCTAKQEWPLHAHQFLAGKLHADGEHEEGHAHFGHKVHHFLVGDEAEGGRAAEHAGEQKAHDGREAEAVADKDDDDGEKEKDGYLSQDEFFHGGT